MYKVVVNVSGKRARIVPGSHKLSTAERKFGDLSLEDALANRGGLDGAVRGLLEENGITDGDLYTVDLPDNLKPVDTSAQAYVEDRDAATSKGPVTKPENPKEGEQNSPTNKPETKTIETPERPREPQEPPVPNEDASKTEADRVKAEQEAQEKTKAEAAAKK